MEKQRRVKQVIVIRKDLNMRKGKMVAQGAHAAVDSLIGMMDYKENDDMVQLCYDRKGVIEKWFDDGVAKICLYVNSEDELVQLFQCAKEKGLPVSLIEDAGITEFHGEVTRTCLAIGPWYADEIDGITGSLKLL